MIALYFHLTHRESARMIVSLRKWRFFNSRFFCSSKSVDIQSIDDFHDFSSQSIHSSNDLYNIHLFEALRHRSIKRKIEVTHTSNHLSNQQTITQNQLQNFRFLNLLHFQHDREIHASFRFVSVSASLSATMTFSEFVTTTNEFASMTSKAHALFCSILYIFAVNIKRWIYYIQRYESKWHEKMKNNSQCEFVARSNQFAFFAIFCQSSMRQRFVLFQNLQPIRTCRLIRTRKAQIRKIWNSIRSRNRYRFVAFAFASAFAFALFWDIDRFIILICKYFSHQFDKIFNKIFISIVLTYIFCSRLRFSVFEFIFLRLSHLRRNFQRQSWSDRYLDHSQWISSQCRSIREMNIRFGTKLEEEKRIVLRACLRRDLDWNLILSAEIHMRTSVTWRTFLLLTFDFHVDICFLDQIFSLCYLFFRHTFYNYLLRDQKHQFSYVISFLNHNA